MKFYLIVKWEIIYLEVTILLLQISFFAEFCVYYKRYKVNKDDFI